MIEEITIYKCTVCGKTYTDKVTECTGCSNRIVVGQIVGPFRVIKKLAVTGKYRVECLLCGFEKEILSSNLKRQSSCGCKPRHIEILHITEHKVRYHCRRCLDNRAEELPIFTYCCTEDFEYEE